MRLYLDDDSVDAVLVRLVHREGHDVRLPADIALAGADDRSGGFDARPMTRPPENGR